MYEPANEYNVEQALQELGVKNYDPDTNTYIPWYRIPFKVEFTQENKTSIVKPSKRKIEINCGEEGKESILVTCLHEFGHVELYLSDLPLMSIYALTVCYMTYKIFPIGSLVTGLGALIFYHKIMREIFAELYSMKKLGWERYKNAWK